MALSISVRSMHAIEGVLKREGGFVNHPNDRGGPTNFGITQRKLIEWRGIPVSEDDVRNMSKEEAIQIYHHDYIEQPNIHLLNDDWLFEYVFDMAVNHGPSKGVKLLQRAACVIEDGLLGPITAKVANSIDPIQLKRALDKERISFYVDIVVNDHSQLVFLKGWVNRTYEVA